MLSDIKVIEYKGKKCVGYFDFYRMLDTLQYEINEIMDEFESADVSDKETYKRRRFIHSKLNETRFNINRMKM